MVLSFISGRTILPVRTCFATWKIVRNVDGEGDRNDFYPLSSSLFLHPFHHVPQTVDGMYDGDDLFSPEMCVFFLKE